MPPRNHAIDEPDTLASTLAELIHRVVVIDTPGPVVYIGTLEAVGQDGFWLNDADVHNTDEGHAPKEEYVHESKHHGVRVNRNRVFVLRSAAMSISALDDAIMDETNRDNG